MIPENIDAAVECLYPLLEELHLKGDFRTEKDFYTIQSPKMDILNLGSCKITIIRERLPNYSLCGQLLITYKKEYDLLHFIIYLNEHLFFNEDVSKKNRKIVAIHEFTHVASHLFAYSMDKDRYFNENEQRFDQKIEEIDKTDVSALLTYFEEKSYDKLDIHKHVNHSHFKIGSEIINFSYTDLYYGLLFPKQMFFKHCFTEKERNKFNHLWQINNRTDAVRKYRHLVVMMAEKEWVSRHFALDRAFMWLMDYIQKSPILSS